MSGILNTGIEAAPEDEEQAIAGVKEHDDGSMTVTLEDLAEKFADVEHFDNLVDVLDAGDLRAAASEIQRLVELDYDAWEDRRRLYKEGIERTGMSNKAPGGADFEGATNVSHPLLLEAAIDFSARAAKELLPANGPVRMQVAGETTKEKLARGERKARYMNWQCTKQIEEFYSVMDTMLTQLPLAGSQYIKAYRDEDMRRTKVQFIPDDLIVLPAAAPTYASAQRRTYVETITEFEFERRVKNGQYSEDAVSSASAGTDTTGPQRAAAKVEGKDLDAADDDGTRIIYEIDLYWDFEKPGERKPYLVSLDKNTGSIVALYRNWARGDQLHTRMEHVVQFDFLPWRGAKGIGLTHIIGGLTASATGALRALLDSAHMNNIATALKLAGGSKGGQTIRMEPGSITEIDGAAQIDDIRKTVMPMPFNPPSAVLYSLLGFVTEAGKGLVQTTFENIADQRPDMPVGTTLALIEQGMTVFSSIHARLHRALKQLLAVLHRLNYAYMEDEEVIEELGKNVVKRIDFASDLDVTPVSDPAIFSEAQRQAQLTLISQRAAAYPHLYDQRAIEERILQQAKIPNPESLLLPDTEPERMNSINENLSMILGRRVMVFPEQDHAAHIKTHLQFFDANITGGTAVRNAILPFVAEHIKQHIAFYYVTLTVNEATAAAKRDISELMDDDEEVDQAFDQTMELASAMVLSRFARDPVVQAATQFLTSTEGVLAELAAQAQEQAIDPNIKAQVQATQQETELKRQIAQMDDAHKRAEAERKAQFEQMQLQLDQLESERRERIALSKQQADAAQSAADNAARERMNNADNTTAMLIAAAEVAQDGRTAMTDGSGIDPQDGE